MNFFVILQKVSNSEFAGNVTAFDGLLEANQGYWNSAAEAIGLASYTDKESKVHTAGELLFHLAKFAVGYLGYSAFATTPEQAVLIETQAFADYVNESISS